MVWEDYSKVTRFVCCVPGSVQGPNEKRLLEDLLDDYNVLERPVANESEPLEIKFGLTLQQIIDVVRLPHLGVSWIFVS